MKHRLTTESREALKTLPLYKSIGFEFSNGWFNLIFDLGQKISDYCIDKNIPLPQMRQIKEKFGTLRFYYIDPNHDDQIRKWVRDAEANSDNICESCGAPAELKTHQGRWFVACSEHTPTDSMTVKEFKYHQQIKDRARRVCSVCDTNGADMYWDGELLIPLCENHKQKFITQEEYFETEYTPKG